MFMVSGYRGMDNVWVRDLPLRAHSCASVATVRATKTRNLPITGRHNKHPSRSEGSDGPHLYQHPSFNSRAVR